MIDEMRALQAFLGGFGAPVRAAYGLDDAETGPYITWSPAAPGEDERTELDVRVWSRGPDLSALTALCAAVGEAVGAGALLPCGENRAVALWAGEPFCRVEGQAGRPGLTCARLNLWARAV